MTTPPGRIALRRQLLSRRDAMHPAERSEKSLALAKKLCAQPSVFQRSILFIYCSYRSEVETGEIIRCAIEQGKIVCVPLTVPATRQLQAIAIRDPQADLAPGYKGIPEPAGFPSNGPVISGCIEVAIIPGVGFDRRGHRLGYGAGYYDRFLALEAPQALRIGLAYSCQVLAELPAEPHDVPMDMLITEEDIYFWPRTA